MKKLWKALGLIALAALVPIRVKKDTETGKKKYQSLLISVDVGPGEEDSDIDIGINLGDGLLAGLASALREPELSTGGSAEAGADEAQAAAGEATTNDFDPEF